MIAISKDIEESPNITLVHKEHVVGNSHQSKDERCEQRRFVSKDQRPRKG